MKKFELIKEACEYEDIEIYGNEFYKIMVKSYGDNEYRIDIEKTDRELPTIYINTDWRGRTDNKYNVESIQVQTTSWGAMEVEEIADVIGKYTIAMETAKEIKKLLDVK